MTQVQLAKASGVPQGLITCYETDSKMPSAMKLAALARALFVPMDALVDGAGKPEPSIQAQEPKIHGNSRGSKVQELFLRLDDETQRVVLKQIKALVNLGQTTSQTNPGDHKRPRKAA